MADSPIIMLELFRGMRLSTNGLTGTGVPGAPRTTLALNVPKFKSLLPYCAGMTLHVLTEDVTAANIVDWNIAFSSGFNRDTEIVGGPFDIGSSAFSAVGSARSSENTTSTNWTLESRLFLWWQNHNGVTGVNVATVSAALALRMVA